MNTTASPKRFIVLGDAGAGKSSFINFLYNYYHGTRKPEEIFCPKPQVKLAIPCADWVDYVDKKYKNNDSEHNINDQTKSQTRFCTTYKIQAENIQLEIIDTPGFNDTNGVNTDEKNLTMIEEALKQTSYINGIILIANGSVPRIGVSFRNFLHMLHQVWPDDLLNNCVAILTNCDELSVNLDSSALERYLHIDKSKKFHLQNSLFRWDPKNQSPKIMRRIKETFQESLETIQPLVDKLLQFDRVSTSSFQNMLNLLRKYREQQVAHAGIVGAQNMMKKNQEWEKRREINAIRWVEVPRRQQLPQTRAYQRRSYQFSFDEQKQILTEDQASYRSMSHDDTDMQSSSPNHSMHLPAYYSEVSQLRKHDRVTPEAGTVLYGNDTNQHRGSAQASENVYVDQAHNGSVSSRQQPFASSPSHNVSVSHSSISTNKPNYTISDNQRYYNQSMREPQNDRNEQRHANSPGKFIWSCCSIADQRSKYPPPSHGPLYQQQQTKVQVTLPDNEAQSHHKYAEQEELKLKKRSCDLAYEQQELEKSMNQSMRDLRIQVAELRSINKKYDIIERHRDLLRAFKDAIECMGGDKGMQRYYDEIVTTLSEKQN